jgi:hypothetical protein
MVRGKRLEDTEGRTRNKLDEVVVEGDTSGSVEDRRGSYNQRKRSAGLGEGETLSNVLDPMKSVETTASSVYSRMPLRGPSAASLIAALMAS